MAVICSNLKPPARMTRQRTCEGCVSQLVHVPATWGRFADKDMRQHDNPRRFLVILDHPVIQYDQETPLVLCFKYAVLLMIQV